LLVTVYIAHNNPQQPFSKWSQATPVGLCGDEWDAGYKMND